MAVSLNLDDCTGCGTCVDVCAFSALEVRDSKLAIDADACAECGACVDECAADALSME